MRPQKDYPHTSIMNLHGCYFPYYFQSLYHAILAKDISKGHHSSSLNGMCAGGRAWGEASGTLCAGGGAWGEASGTLPQKKKVYTNVT